ncbi:type II toxin-antitoxin system VapC family toxin [Mucilaginibacter sp.]|uniref:type II toxin-antitoxin system VapC family toxin n=1 Tax=Mucilaginibacter sp. TaxID=1882438 RepID=UPI003B00C775
MNYLLDTHVLLWAINDDTKLSENVKERIKDIENSIFVSAISFWEISLKFSLGKLKLKGFMPDDLTELSTKIGFKLIPLLHDVCGSYHHLISTIHRDPFDRMLIWQAIKQNYILITKDNKANLYIGSGLKTLW